MVHLELETKLLSLQSNMYNFAYSLTVNKERAEDLLQETTLKALTNSEKFIDNTNFKGWVLTIMKNIFINGYRKNLRSQTMLDSTDNSYYLNIPQTSGFDTPESAYSINEINKCINAFSNEYRIPFSMHVSGFKYHEIAEKMDLPIGTVKSRIFFARQRLQESLKDYK